MSENLWGQFPDAEQIDPPIVLLKQQAGELQKVTNGILTALVKSKPSGTGFELSLMIVATALSYAAQIVNVQHPVALYPLWVLNSLSGGGALKCEDHAQYKAAVAGVLSSEPVHKLVAALMAQVRAMESAE